MADIAAQSYQETSELVAAVVDIAKRTLKRWQILLVGFVLAVAAGGLLPKVMLPVYQAQSTLMYRNTVTAASVVVERETVEGWKDKSVRYRELVVTRTNLEAIVKDLDLYPKVVASSGIAVAAERLRADLRIGLPSGTLITLFYSTTDKSKLLPVLERIEKSFKEQPVLDSVEEAKATKAFLDKQYEAASADLAQKEALLAAFIAAHPEFAQADRAPGGGIGARLQASESAPSEGRTTTLRRQISRIEARLAALDSPSSVAPPETRIVPADQQRIDAAQRVAATARERLAQLRAQFTEAHPDVQAAKADVAKAQGELTSAQSAARTETLPNLIAPSADSGPEARAALADQLKRLKAELSFVELGAAGGALRKSASRGDFVDSLVALETEWASRQREVENARERHASIGQRLFQADTIVKLVSLAGTGQIVTLDPAYEPRLPSARGRMGTAFKGFAGVAFASLLVALAVTLLDGRVFRVQSLSRIGESGAILATIPRAEGAQK